MKITNKIILASTIMILLALFLKLVIIITESITPTDDEIKTMQIEQVQAIKLCVDNDLKAYQSLSGKWFCEPK